MSKAPQATINELVENNKTTVPILRQILEYYRKQKTDLQHPTLKAELQELLRRCLANNNLVHIKSYKRYGNNLVFPPTVDSKSDSDLVSNVEAKSKTGGEVKNKNNSSIILRASSKPTKPLKKTKVAKTAENGARSRSEPKKHIISTDILADPQFRKKSYESTPSKYAHIWEMLDEETKDFTEISSHNFNETHLRQAKVHFDIETDDMNITTTQSSLPKFPWLVFDVNEIPMHQAQMKHLDARDVKKVVKLEDKYDMNEGDWTISHVNDDKWEQHFGDIKSRFNKRRIGFETHIELIADTFCAVFGLTEMRYYKLHHHPGFDISPFVKPDVSVSHWHLSPNTGKVYAKIDHPMTPLLEELASKKSQWFPLVSLSVLPHIVVECTEDPAGDKSDVVKLLIEMAMIRDLEERFYKKPRRFTLGFYIRQQNWQVFVLENTNKDPNFKYEAHRVASFDLTNDYLTWLQLGVVMVRLAAYQTCCTLKLVPKTKEELIDVLEEANTILNQRENTTRHPKQIKDAHNAVKGHGGLRKKKQTKKAAKRNKTASNDHKDKKGKKRKADHYDEGPDRKRFKKDPNNKSDQNNVNGYEKIEKQLLQKEGLIYSGCYTRIYRCFDEVTGQEVAIKEFDSPSEGYREAGLLSRLPGRGIVKRVRGEFTELNGKVQIWLELLSPLPEYNELHDLKHFMRGFLEALDYMHFQNFIHGDVKHDNVMVDPETNEIKLIDFGFSVEIWPGCTCRYFHGGTHVYFAPERIYDEPQTNKIDVFSAGLVCAEKMYGVQIRSLKTRDLLIKKVDEGELSGLATEEGVDLLQQMLREDPDQRFSADECLQHPFLNDDMDVSY